MSKPRVLLISHSCRNESEGHQRAAALYSLGEVELLTITPRRWRFYGKWTDVEYPERLSFELRDKAVLFPWLPYIGSHLHTYIGLRDIILGFEPDIIDIWEEPWALVSAHTVAIRNAHLPNAKLLIETEQNKLKRLPPPFGTFWKFTCSNADFLVGRSHDAVEISRTFGYSGPSSVIGNGVDVNVFEPQPKSVCRVRIGLPEDCFLVGYVGRLVPEKGIDDLFDAVATVNSRVQVVLIGDGPYLEALRNRARKLGIIDRVNFHPAVRQANLPQIMGALDVLCLPSRTAPNWKEQFGRVLAEAGACEIPVIGSDSGAIPDVIGNAGLVFPEQNPVAMAKCIQMLAADPGLCARLGKVGRAQAIHKYSWERVAEQYNEILIDLADGKYDH